MNFIHGFMSVMNGEYLGAFCAVVVLAIAAGVVFVLLLTALKGDAI